MRIKIILVLLILGSAIYFALPRTEGSSSLLKVEVDMWGDELSTFCQNVRRVRNAQQEPARSAINAALDASACTERIGADDMRNSAPPRPATPPPAAVEPAPVQQQQVEPQIDAPAIGTPVQRQEMPAGNPAEHMQQTCARMLAKLDDSSLSDVQWRQLAGTYNELCLQ